MLTKVQAKKLFGSYYRVAQLCGIHRSAVGRWGKYVPTERESQLLAVPEDKRKVPK